MVKGVKGVKGKAGTDTWVLISLFFFHREQIDLKMNLHVVKLSEYVTNICCENVLNIINAMHKCVHIYIFVYCIYMYFILFYFDIYTDNNRSLVLRAVISKSGKKSISTIVDTSIKP